MYYRINIVNGGNEKPRRRLQASTGQTEIRRNARLQPRELESTAFRPNWKGDSVANRLSKDQELAVLRCLVEGNSIRGTERITGVYRNTVMRLLVRFGQACDSWMDLNINNLHLRHLELDEIWTFCGKKDKMCKGAEKKDPELGSQYLYLALDLDTKLIASYKLGKRNHVTTRDFVNDLESRMICPPAQSGEHRPQISTDGWASYPGTIDKAFGQTVRHGVIIKQYKNPEVGRYAPPDLRGTDRFSVQGIKHLWTICTSHIERFNLSVRTFMKRFTRLALGFSKKLENLEAAISLHIAHYNFCWRMREPGNSGKLRVPPAMAVGLVDELWALEDLYDAVAAHDREQKSMAKYKSLADKLRKG